MTQATVLGSETHRLHSTHTGREYEIAVALPLGYHAQPGERWPFNHMPEKWPVVYVLDGNWYFAMVAGMVRPISWCGNTTDAIVVGIGYPEDQGAIEGFRTSFTRRDHDLTPVHDAATEKSMTEGQARAVPNGDAPNFHLFLKNELIPLIEREYRADPTRRVLAGHSYGGLFALYGLFVTPELFQTLIVGSPYLAYADRVLFLQEEEFAGTHSELPVRIFFFASTLEMDASDSTLADTLLIAAKLESRRYRALTIKKQIFTEFNHCEVAPAGIHAGLVFALKT